MDTRAILDWGTLAIAVLGAVLGVHNTWRAVLGDRVKLRVRIHATAFGLRPACIQIVNLSAFPVTIVQAGWVEQRGRWSGRTLHDITPADVGTASGALSSHPIEIQPRRPQLIVFEHASSIAKVIGSGRVFVVTACGVRVRSPAIPKAAAKFLQIHGGVNRAASK